MISSAVFMDLLTPAMLLSSRCGKQAAKKPVKIKPSGAQYEKQLEWPRYLLHPLTYEAIVIATKMFWTRLATGIPWRGSRPNNLKGRHHTPTFSHLFSNCSTGHNLVRTTALENIPCSALRNLGSPKALSVPSVSSSNQLCATWQWPATSELDKASLHSESLVPEQIITVKASIKGTLSAKVPMFARMQDQIEWLGQNVVKRW